MLSYPEEYRQLVLEIKKDLSNYYTSKKEILKKVDKLPQKYKLIPGDFRNKSPEQLSTRNGNHFVFLYDIKNTFIYRTNILFHKKDTILDANYNLITDIKDL